MFSSISAEALAELSYTISSNLSKIVLVIFRRLLPVAAEPIPGSNDTVRRAAGSVTPAEDFASSSSK